MISVLAATAALVPVVPPLEPLTQGRLVVVRNWLPADLTAALRDDGIALREAGVFAASGLSNTAKGGKSKQGFGRADRAVCPVTPDLGGNREARAEFARRLEAVRLALETDGRPQLQCREQYYSVSNPGAALARHMDERHEELKGARGYSAPYRRSISWLCYLCEDGWDEANGPGAGNLQVGWRRGKQERAAEPVFLDAWVRAEVKGWNWLPADVRSVTPQYASLAALYRVAPDGTRNYLSRGVEGGGAHTVDDALQTMAPAERARFARVEVSKEATEPPPGAYEVAVPPLGGTLLLFDSVAVPHEVQATTAGERWAMAGWLHEPSQSVPSWLT